MYFKWLTVLLVVFDSAVRAQTPTPAPSSPEIPYIPFLFESTNRLNFDVKSFDFGEIKQGDRLVHEFVIRNGSKKEIKIENISTSCECVGAEGVETGRILQPDESGKIKVTLDSSPLSDSFVEAVFIETDEKILSSYVLTLKGRAQIPADKKTSAVGTPVLQGSPGYATLLPKKKKVHRKH
jgi:hypothetical protein